MNDWADGLQTTDRFKVGSYINYSGGNNGPGD